MTLPVAAKFASNANIVMGVDSGSLSLSNGTISGSTLTLCKGASVTAATWTASGNKYADFTITYEAA